MATESLTDAQLHMLQEVIEGLTQPQKTLPPKYFYDKKGSELFDQITRLEEYYPTRTEKEILETSMPEIVKTLGLQVLLIEPGSGNSFKTRLLLENLKKLSGYIPLDISGDFLYKCADELQEDYPNIAIIPIQADYTRPFELPDFPAYCRKVAFFPGSTIGNFERDTVNRFLKTIHDIIGDDGAFLIGVDLVKDIKVLEAAYNDKEGVTAEFNLNILQHINDELGSNFDLSKFEHEAIYNSEKDRIEMYLHAKEDHQVQLNGTTIQFIAGESIHTENSHKYSMDTFKELVNPWFEVAKFWTDKNEYFSLFYLTPK